MPPRPHSRARHDDADGDDDGARARDVERRAEPDARRDRAEPDRGRRRGGSVRASDREGGSTAARARRIARADAARDASGGRVGATRGR